ncbi:TPA: beta strand repeat-containing protein, partial [Salmonella enterica subsp. enterica serovar Newport]
ISTLTVSNSNFKANGTTGKIVLNGTTETTTGVKVAGSSFSAASMEVKGVATKQGTGFALTSSHLLDGLADLKNVIFSSAGSAVGATNTLDSSIVTADTRDTLLAWHPENMTKIDMGGNAIFDDTTATTKGWVKDYSSDAGPSAGWIFNNTTVTADGDVTLKGASFTNATLNLSSGNLSITNNGSVQLTGANISLANGSVALEAGSGGINLTDGTLNITEGRVSAHAVSGDINLTRGNISAKQDINLKADNGSLTISGGGANSLANIASTDGNISFKSTSDGSSGLTIINTKVDAGKDINMDGVANRIGLKIKEAEVYANQGRLNINASARSSVGDYDEALYLLGNIVFSTKSGTTINATHQLHASSYQPPKPLVIQGANLTFDGGGVINAIGSYAGIIVQESDMLYPSKSQLFAKNGDLIINAKLDGLASSGPAGAGGSSASGAVVFDNGYSVVSLDINADKGSNIIINADSSANKGYSFAAFAAATPESTSAGSHANGFVFSGAGNISVNAISGSADAVNVRLFNNENLTGHLTITGESDSGTGVNFDNYLATKVSNASISGSSKSGVGLKMIARSGSADLRGNEISGLTAAGSSGISLSGKNITIANGSLSGSSTSGNGTGVALVGSTNFTIDGANVTGQSVDGSGVSISGNLSVNNNATLIGTASGNGTGVTVAGNLKSEGGVKIDGTATTGDGVKVTGDTLLTNATLSGTTRSGSGVNIAGNLTTDTGTLVTGTATDDGTGVNLGASLSGANVTGVSHSGAGVTLADNANVTLTTLSGTSTSGSGVAVVGNVILDDVTAQKLSAGSVSGSGLLLDNNANVSVLNISHAEKQKTDADGNPMVDLSGNPLMETVTTVVPVSTPVSLSGTSQTGSGIATAGEVAIRGIILNGTTASDDGVGVTLGGNLTVADAISGINASATGNGAALKISGGVVDAKGYADAGKTLVISATSEDGAAVSASGNSILKNVELKGTTGGNGSAVVVSGSLSTDKSLTAISTGDKGTGLELAGGLLQSTAADNTPVKVTVSATGNGTAVAVTEPESGQSGSGLSGIDLNASADKGTVMDIDGDLTTDRDISVSTENGVALSLNGGSLQGAESEHPVTVTVQATGDGTAVTVKPTDKGKPGSSLANMTLHTTSAQGDALNVGGELNTKKVVVEAGTTGTGTALNVSGGEIHSRGETDIVATSDSGHAAVINNGKLTGDSAGALTVKAATKTDSPALDIRGTSDISNSVVSGKNSGNGSAVSVAGVVTSSGGGEIKGQTVNGTAVKIKDGTSVTSSQEGGLLITATASGEKGTGVALSNATLTGSRINADATQGNAVTIVDGSITGGNIAGHTTAGTGLNISNAVLKEAVV